MHQVSTYTSGLLYTWSLYYAVPYKTYMMWCLMKIEVLFFIVPFQPTTDEKLAGFIENCVCRAREVLGETNYQRLTTDWRPGGINPNRFPEHAGYIQQLVRAVVSQVTALVDKARSDKKARIRESEYYSDFDEVLHHLRFCNLKCKSFCGQTAVLKQVKDFVLNSSVRHPLIIHANSGAGKTSVMAMIMKNLSSWIKGDFVGVIRFLGTSPGSVNIQNVLFSVCGQLADCGDLIMEPVGYKNMESLVDYLPRFLRQVASTLKQPVIILLDSIDQLSPANDAYSMWWMPTALPANMKLIISTLPSENDILANIKKKLPATNSGSSSFLEIPPLPQSTGKEITEVFLKMKQRKVTEQQMGLLLTTFAKCANPLYLKLLLDEAVQWGSYSPVEDLVHTLAPSVRAAINVLFDRLEKKFGEVLIKGALGYITVGLNGVSDIELEDALSCDDTVLDDVYAFHDPPIPGIVRIPSVMWARIRYDIGGYLVERLSEGKITLFWYHRQFLEAARDRYADEKNKPSLHKTMYEIYVAESGVKKDIFLSKRKKLIPLADRQVTPQPMYPDNLRKLKCLTHHLIQASSSLDSSIAKGKVFCNLRFLCTKISALSANAVASDMEEYLKITPDEEISVVKNFLQSNKNNLKSSLVLASSLLGYINPNSDQKYLVDLLQNAKAYLQSQNRPILIPAFACLASSGCCHATVRGFSTVVTSNDSKLLLYGEAVDDMDRDSHQKLANGARKTDQTASYDLETHAIGWTSTGLSPFRILLFDLQMKEKWIGDTYKALLELSLQSHAVNAARTYACVLFKDGNLFLLKLNSKKSEGFQCLSHIKQSSDYTATEIHCIGDGSGITVIASCQQSIEQERCGHILIWKTLPDETFDRRSSADDTVLSQYTIKGIFTIFETEPHIPIAKLSLDGKVEKGMSFPCGQNKFVSVCSTGVVTVIDLDRCEIVRSWEAGLIQNACVSATGTQLLVHGNGNLKLFDITDESVLQTMSARLEITAMRVLWEEKIALTSHSNGVISLFDLNTGREVSAFPANSFGVTNILAVGKYFVFTSDMHAITILTKEYILDQSKMTSESDERLIYDVCPTKTGLEVITSTYGCLKICALDGTCIRSVPSEGRLDNLYPGVGDLVLCLDAMTKSLTVLNINSGESLMDKTLPSDIIALTLTDDKTNAYAVCGFTLAVYRIDLKALRVSKLFALQKRIIHEGISIKLTASNRYLVLQVRCAEQDYQAVKTLWKKGGRYPTQPHPHKYLAVDLTQGSGSVSSCLRPLTKIPHLGVACAPYRGNVVMLAVKRHVIFWDIPSSKCDQWMSKSKKLVMLYRPDWTGGDKCTGSTVCLAQSRDGTFIAVGSQDGYLFVYNSESGLPVGMKAPSTKHPSMVSTDTEPLLRLLRSILISQFIYTHKILLTTK